MTRKGQADDDGGPARREAVAVAFTTELIVMTIDRFRPRVGALALVIGAFSLLVAQLIRPDHGESAAAIFRAVEGADGAAANASLLYLVAAAALAIGLVAVPASVPAGRGARLLLLSVALAVVGTLWFAVEAALMQFVDNLAAAPNASQAAAQLEALNAGFGVIAVLPWFFYIAPLGIAIALWRAGLVGSLLVGLWVAGFAAGFAANSPLGESIPALVTANDVLLSALIAGIAAIVVRAGDGSRVGTARVAGATSAA
jgi:hypothetical protein